MASDVLTDDLAGLQIASNDSFPPPPPPMPTSAMPPGFNSGTNGAPGNRGGAPPPPPPPGMGLEPAQTYKQMKEQNFQEQQMANLPSGLMMTAAKADKKPFSYTPVGLSAADLKSPSSIRKDKLDAGEGGVSGITAGTPRAPTHYVRIFNGITPPPPSYDTEKTSPTPYPGTPPLQRSNSTSSSGKGDAPDKPRHKNATNPTLQSRSFRILQWMTGADEEDDSIAPSIPSEPDEMHFRGYNQANSIPSRAFQTLDRMTSADGQNNQNPAQYNRPVHTPEPEPFRTDLTDEQGANLRYGGGSIPSRSFKILQNMTENDAFPLSQASQHARASPLTVNTAHQNFHQQPSYGYNSPLQHNHIPPPSPQDFKYQGPQYSTYSLPNQTTYQRPASPAVSQTQGPSQPRFSSAVSFTPSPALANDSFNNYNQQQKQQPAYNSRSPSNSAQQNPNYYNGANHAPARQFSHGGQSDF